MSHKTKLFNDLLRVLSLVLDYDEGVKLQHGWRVGVLSYRIAQVLNLADPGSLYHAGLLHDIGGVGLSDHVVHAALAEFADPTSREHPDLGAAILRPVGVLRHLEPIIRDHHEQFDGRGFPRHKYGEQIPLGASIVLIADLVDVNLRGHSPDERRRLAPVLVKGMADKKVPAHLAHAAAQMLHREPELVDALFDDDGLEALVAGIDAPPPFAIEDYSQTDLLMQVLGVLVRVIDASHDYMAGHSVRVAYYAHKIAKSFDERELNHWDITIAGLIHDLGIVGIPQDVLRVYPHSARSPAQQAAFQKHAEITAELLGQIEYLAHLAFPTACHHEAYDGTGYPYHLNNEQIPLMARVLAYADMYDSVCSELDVSPRLQHEAGMDALRSARRKQLDPNLWDIAERIFHRYGVASDDHEQRVQQFSDSVFSDDPSVGEMFEDEPQTVRRAKVAERGIVLIGVEQWRTLLTDRDFKITYGEEHLSRLLAHPAPPLFVDVLRPEDAQLLRTKVSRLAGVASFSEMFITRPGPAIEVLVTKKSSELLQIHVRSAERQVQTLKHISMLQKNFVGSLEAVLITDADARIIDANEALSRVFGYELEELLGKDVALLGLPDFPPEPSSFVVSPSLSATGTRGRSECQVQTKDGTPIWLMSSTSVLRDARGEVVGYLAHIMDVTQRKHQEQALIERDELLNKRNKELESLYQMESQLSAIASHDIRSPLSSMITGATLLRDVGDNMPAERRVAMLNNLIESGHHTLRLLQSTLDLRKLESGEKHIELSPTQISDVVEASVKRCQMTAPRGITIQHRTSRKGLMVEADGTKLDQIVANLVCNAVKFSPDNGKIDVLVECPDDENVVVTVADEGPGIPESDLESIFDKYFQVKKQGSVPARGHGVGLGLSIVRYLVELHKGTVWAENRPTGGSLFVVRLPLYRQPRRPVATPVLGVQKPSAWIVRDPPLTDHVVVETLRRLGFRYDIVDPEQLRDRESLHAPQVVFDLSAASAQQIRQRLRDCHGPEPVIVAVADSDLESFTEYENVLVRPVLDVEVANLVETVRMGYHSPGSEA